MRLLACGLAVFAAATAVVDAQPPASWVTVTGQVVLPANVPVPGPKVFPLFPAVPDERVLVDAKTRGVKNVVVWLRPDNLNPKAKLAASDVHPADARRGPRVVPVRITPQQVFDPHVLAVRAGDTLQVVSQSPVPTPIDWSSSNNGELAPVLNPGQVFQFPAPLVPEPWMVPLRSGATPASGYVRIYEHPYYAVTDAAGRFELKDAPAGKYRLVYWHENKGYKGGKDGRFGEPVEIAPGKGGRQELPPTPFNVL